jgi:flagellar biosynthesis/type III secretory pathway protein FliH
MTPPQSFRFDSAAPPQASSSRRLLLGQMPVEEVVIDPIQDALTPASEVESGTDQNVSGRVPEFAEIEIMLTALSDTIERLERESREQAVSVTQSIAARLFPELSRLFLAEEIGRHLPGMVPSTAPAVEIRAQPALLERLRDVVEKTASLSERCSVVPAETTDDEQVRVSWETGGLTFDFDGLLNACLAQLEPPPATIEE